MAGLGSFFVVSHALQFLWRPLPRILEAIDAARAQLGLESPIVGVHVRHGDGTYPPDHITS